MTMLVRISNEEEVPATGVGYFLKVEVQHAGRRKDDTAFRTTSEELLAPRQSIDLYLHAGQKVLLSEVYGDARPGATP